MNEENNQFETYRPLLFSIAYRMMGTAMEAEDVVQDAYIRYITANTEEVKSHKYYLTTIVTRLCINKLQSARAQRETQVGPWLPEPIVTDNQPEEFMNPADKVSKYDSISMAFLVLLEKLSPPERAVFLLREVFDYEYDEIGKMIDKTESACRQLFSRAKKHIHDNQPRFDSTPEEHNLIFTQFLQAIEAGDMDGLVSMLTDDTVMLTDGGTKRGRATRPVYGKENVAKFAMSFKRRADIPYTLEFKPINGYMGLIVRLLDGTPYFVLTAAVANGKIQQLHLIGNDDKLKHV
jgi:RNA polymerase sigma-70 factor, ECF subfamily